MDQARRWDPRRRHPDDYLRDLARSGRAPTSPILRRGHRRARDLQVRRIAMATAVTSVLLVVAIVPLLFGNPTIKVTGIEADAVLNASAVARLRAQIRIVPVAALADADIRVNGTAIATTTVSGARVFAPGTLAPGDYELSVRSGGWRLWRPPSRTTIRFTVDTALPALTVDWPAPAQVALDKPYVITGRTEPGAKVQVAGLSVEVDVNGAFSAEFAAPPVGTIRVDAFDAAGNVVERDQRAGIVLPRTRAVYMSSDAWMRPERRAAFLELVAADRVNAVVIDVKDDAGRVPHTSAVRRALEIGAVQRRYDLAALVAEMHARDVRVIGRLVTFRDATLADAEWAAGRTDWVVQARSGGPAEGETLGRFTNPYERGVREYYAALAVEAARAGVDELLLDGVRRPDLDVSEHVFPGGEGAIEDQLVAFVSEIAVALQGTPTRLGLTLSHSVAIAPERSGQDVARLARIVDVLAPVTFPSSHDPGDLGVEDPLFDPDVIVYRSLERIVQRTRGTGVRLTPWIQDFSRGRRFGPRTLGRQLRSVDQIGLSTWILMNPSGTYSTDGIPVAPPEPVAGAPLEDAAVDGSSPDSAAATSDSSAEDEEELASPG